ncbi:MAG: right-handed parallel beta-helix repeat-containing protein [Limisphaerales bacterium]
METTSRSEPACDRASGSRRPHRWPGIPLWFLLGFLLAAPTALRGQVILVLADDLDYTFIVPAVPERFDDDRRVEVRVGVNAATTDPVLTFAFAEIRQERRFTRQVDASLRGQRFEIEITHPSRTFSTSFIVGQTLGTLFEDAVWDRDRLIEGSSPFALLQGGVHVPAGVTLTIRGGAVIDGFEPTGAPNHRNRSPFLVNGTLIVENATLKNLLINTDNLFFLKRSAAEQIRIADSTLTNVVLDAHMSGSTALLNVTSTLDDPVNRWTLRPFGTGGDLVVQNCTFSHRLQVLLPQFAGITPPKVVFQANRFTNPSDFEVQPVGATFEFLGNTFTTGGIRLAVADGRGFLIENNTASRINTLPASNRDPSDDFDIRITQTGTADGAVRRIRGNQGVATVDLRADDVEVRDNLITLPTLQNRGDYQAGIFVAGSDNVIENNTVTGPARGSFGIRVGHRNVAGFRTDDNADADRNRVLGNTVTRWLDGGIALHSGDNNVIEGNLLLNNSPNFLLGSEDKSPTAAVPGPGNRFSNNHVSKPFRSGVDRPFNFFVDGLCTVLFCPMTLDGGGITPGTSIAGGPNLGGNFWDHHQGTDTNGDGIGDTPFVLGSAGIDSYVDRFPLMAPPPVVDIIVNLVGDEPDADLNDGVADVDLGRAGLQTTLRAAIQLRQRHGSGTRRPRGGAHRGQPDRVQPRARHSPRARRTHRSTRSHGGSDPRQSNSRQRRPRHRGGESRA